MRSHPTTGEALQISYYLNVRFNLSKPYHIDHISRPAKRSLIVTRHHTSWCIPFTKSMSSSGLEGGSFGTTMVRTPRNVNSMNVCDCRMVEDGEQQIKKVCRVHEVDT